LMFCVESLIGEVSLIWRRRSSAGKDWLDFSYAP